MHLEGVFVCVRCGAELTDLRIAPGEGTVCVSEEACELWRALEETQDV